MHTSHYSRLEKTPTIPLATQDYHIYILHVVYITTHTHNRRKSIGKKDQRTNKRRKILGGSTGESATRPGCHVFFRRSTAVLRTTSNTPTAARTTGQLRDRQLSVVVTCLCVGGPCVLPLVGSCLGKTCGVLKGLTAAAHQNVRSHDPLFLQEMSFFFPSSI